MNIYHDPRVTWHVRIPSGQYVTRRSPAYNAAGFLFNLDSNWIPRWYILALTSSHG